MIIYICMVWLVGIDRPESYQVPDYYWTWQAYSNSLNMRWLDDEGRLNRTIWAEGTWEKVECHAPQIAIPVPIPEPEIIPYDGSEASNQAVPQEE